MSPTTAPERISWAIELLDVRGPERLLEVGCGSGLALDVVARMLTSGQITGVDRSARAIALARRRAAAHLTEGRATLVHADLRRLDLAASSIDAAFAVNVNVFWTAAADPELDVLGAVLRPGGMLHLVYETPGSSERPVATAEQNLRRHGLATSTSQRGRMAAISGRR